MACNFYNFEGYGKLGIPVKKTIKCGDCPHNMNGFCDWFKMKLVESEPRKLKEFHLITNDETGASIVIGRGQFENIQAAKDQIADKINPGFYCILDTETREELHFESKEMGADELADWVTDLISGMFGMEVNPVKKCQGCDYNERGHCLKHNGLKLIDAKALCYTKGFSMLDNGHGSDISSKRKPDIKRGDNDEENNK